MCMHTQTNPGVRLDRSTGMSVRILRPGLSVAADVLKVAIPWP